ncbi:MAG: phage tail assembly protein [Jaaginema sp. PMC 1080.18]|nr:phage tail assembly protein [Jaaginema sp. PMC 1080.18]MEC4866511.1 phage tail assembly protein [Jaaginema sp. PMC 1078.18]
MSGTEFSFILPKGWLSSTGALYRQGKMRLTTGEDELAVQRDSRVQENSGYGVFVLLARVVTEIGELTAVKPEELEQLFLPDFVYLQSFYNRVNQYQGEFLSSGEL